MVSHWCIRVRRCVLPGGQSRPPLRVHTIPHWGVRVCSVAPPGGVEPRPYGSVGGAVETCNSGRGKPLPYVTTKGARFAACQTFCGFFLLFCANGQLEIMGFLLTTGAGVCYNPDNLSDTPRELLREGALRYAEPPQQQLHDGHDDVHLHGDVQPLACAESGMSFVVPGRGLNRTKERLLGWKRRCFQPFLICGGNCFD